MGHEGGIVAQSSESGKADCVVLGVGVVESVAEATGGGGEARGGGGGDKAGGVERVASDDDEGGGEGGGISGGGGGTLGSGDVGWWSSPWEWERFWWA